MAVNNNNNSNNNNNNNNNNKPVFPSKQLDKSVRYNSPVITICMFSDKDILI
jgi:hypothetical protein